VYEEVKQMCSALSAMDWDIITGGGPGLSSSARGDAQNLPGADIGGHSMTWSGSVGSIGAFAIASIGAGDTGVSSAVVMLRKARQNAKSPCQSQLRPVLATLSDRDLEHSRIIAG
jgi:hypothetical protein